MAVAEAAFGGGMVRELSCAELKDLLEAGPDKVTVVDLREHDRTGGSVPGAVFVHAAVPPEDDKWLEHVASMGVRPGGLVVFTCLRGGVRSRIRASLFAARHPPPETETAVLVGGVAEWMATVPLSARADFKADQWSPSPSPRHISEWSSAAGPAGRSPRPGVVFVRHGSRIDYEVRGNGGNWVAANLDRRPWDPWLTSVGHMQAEAAGLRIFKDLEEWGLLPPTLVFSSPFLRCAETAVSVAKILPPGSRRVRIEPGLSERMDEKWFRSWAVPGANSKYGGPPHCSFGVEVADEDLHRRARDTPQDLLFDAAGLAGVVKEEGVMDTEHRPLTAYDTSITWGSWDSNARVAERHVECIRKLREAYPGQTIVLVGHSGPLRETASRMSGVKMSKETGDHYCCVYAFREAEDGKDLEMVLGGCSKHSAALSAGGSLLPHTQTDYDISPDSRLSASASA
eukprot:Hpha_TRINITY_DN8976_c0_g1::TRINITY_DN8976_c0_g1_i1::g.80919::m.80919